MGFPMFISQETALSHHFPTVLLQFSYGFPAVLAITIHHCLGTPLRRHRRRARRPPGGSIGGGRGSWCRSGCGPLGTKATSQEASIAGWIIWLIYGSYMVNIWLIFGYCVDNMNEIYIYIYTHWLVVWNMNSIFPFGWEFHHPNWGPHTLQRGWNHQSDCKGFPLQMFIEFLFK